MMTVLKVRSVGLRTRLPTKRVRVDRVILPTILNLFTISAPWTLLTATEPFAGYSLVRPREMAP
jgi:hypothetical protein